jgi:hypothetical protein
MLERLNLGVLPNISLGTPEGNDDNIIGMAVAAKVRWEQRLAATKIRANVEKPLEVTHSRGHLILVPKGGLEPPHPCGYMDLNHARLPIPPLRQPKQYHPEPGIPHAGILLIYMSIIANR